MSAKENECKRSCGCLDTYLLKLLLLKLGLGIFCTFFPLEYWIAQYYFFFYLGGARHEDKCILKL